MNKSNTTFHLYNCKYLIRIYLFFLNYIAMYHKLYCAIHNIFNTLEKQLLLPGLITFYHIIDKGKLYLI